MVIQHFPGWVKGDANRISPDMSWSMAVCRLRVACDLFFLNKRVFKEQRKLWKPAIEAYDICWNLLLKRKHWL
jgi:hypothetical protein